MFCRYIWSHCNSWPYLHLLRFNFWSFRNYLFLQWVKNFWPLCLRVGTVSSMGRILPIWKIMYFITESCFISLFLPPVSLPALPSPSFPPPPPLLFCLCLVNTFSFFRGWTYWNGPLIWLPLFPHHNKSITFQFYGRCSFTLLHSLPSWL